MYLASYIRKLKDSRGEFICPATRSSAVYFDDDTTLSKLSFYPVGSIFQSTDSTSPASLFGGNWERIQNRFLYGSGTYSVTNTGGSTSHTLTTNELPSHSHSFQGSFHRTVRLRIVGGSTQYQDNTVVREVQNAEQMTGAATGKWATIEWTDGGTIGNTGEGNGFSIMPPYYCVNIWRRTA